MMRRCSLNNGMARVDGHGRVLGWFSGSFFFSHCSIMD